MTLNQAIAKAKRMAHKTQEPWYVIQVSYDDNYGPYNVTDYNGFETFWQDISDNDIVVCID